MRKEIRKYLSQEEKNNISKFYDLFKKKFPPEKYIEKRIELGLMENEETKPKPKISVQYTSRAVRKKTEKI